MPHPDDKLTVQWLNSKYGPDALRVSLIPYRCVTVQFTDFACVYAEPPVQRWISLQSETPNINKRQAARVIRGFTPTEEWQGWVEYQKSLIRTKYSWATSEEALLGITRKETARFRVPMAMMCFGLSVPDREDVAVLYCHTALEINPALSLLRDAWEYLA